MQRGLRGHPIRGLLFRWVLRHARGRVRDRENLRFERTRLFGRVRRIFVEIGERFAEAGVLESARGHFSVSSTMRCWVLSGAPARRSTSRAWPRCAGGNSRDSLRSRPRATDSKLMEPFISETSSRGPWRLPGRMMRGSGRASLAARGLSGGRSGWCGSAQCGAESGGDPGGRAHRSRMDSLVPRRLRIAGGAGEPAFAFGDCLARDGDSLDRLDSGGHRMAERWRYR